jgi:hypothetical protein
MAAICLSLFPSARAQTTISGAQTTPESTATANSGQPNDISITSTGSIAIATGAAVTINSSNSVTNDGSITVTNATNAPGTGILVQGGYTGSISTSGTISAADTTPATTLSLVNGSYSLTAGTNRYGIQVAGPFDGSITQSDGEISARGNDSAAIQISGSMTGSLTQSTGTIDVTGNNSYGVQTTGVIGGGLNFQGTVSAFGQYSSAISVQNSVAGQIVINATVSSNGFYNGGQTLARPIPVPTNLTPGNEQLAGPAVSIVNNTGVPLLSIGNGVLLSTSADVRTLGSAPALAINAGFTGGPTSAGTLAINKGAQTYGVEIDGTVVADGIYDKTGTTPIPINAIAIQVGGLGGTTTISGGIGITGTILAKAFASNATAISIQNGASGITLDNTGTITAVVGRGENGNAAVVGNATAILDGSGGLTSITNSGTIKESTPTGEDIAMDLRGNTSGVTITQMAVTSATAPTVPTITGDLLLGSNTTLNLDAGTITGAINFGAGNNAWTILGGAQFTGAWSEANGGAIALDIKNGLLTETSLNQVTLSSLTIGASGQLVLAVDPATGKNGSVDVTGSVMFTPGAKLGLQFQSKLIAPETFTLITAPGSAGYLNGPTPLALGDVPYFYVGTVQSNPTTGSLSLSLRDRTFAEAGVPGNAAAYNAIFAAYNRDPGVFTAMNSASTQQSFKDTYRQELPAYAGGLFEMLSSASDALVRAQTDSPIVVRGDRSGAWAQQIGFGAEQNTSGSTPGYHGGGLGFAFGWEEPASDISTIGYTVGYLRGNVDDSEAGPLDHQVGSIYSGGVYWREIDGQFRAIASLNAGLAELNSQRNFAGYDATGTAFNRSASMNWTGGMARAHLGIDYEQPLGDGYYVRPQLAGDYFVLYEGSHAEHNGGSALDLAYNSSTGKQGAGTGAVSFGVRFGDEFIWRPEVTVGWKQVFGGPDSVTSQFISGGSSFTLTPPSQKGGALARIGIHGGDKYTDIALEAGGEDRGSYRAFDGQLVARFGF